MARRRRGSLSFCDLGFTLLELIVALAILGILAAIAIPTWSTLLPVYALNSAARQVQSELHRTKSRATAENTRFRLVFLAASYEIQRHDGTKYVDTGEDKPLPEGIEIRNVAATPTLGFTPRGTPTSNGTLNLCNTKGTGKNIVVSSTGRIRIENATC